MDAETPTTVWSRLNWDLTELILARLPLRSIVVSAAVCRSWRAVVSDPAFAARAAAAAPRRPWFFLHGHHNVLHRRNQSFAFDPDSGAWAALPSPDDLLSGHGGFSFAATPSPTRFSFGPLLRAGPQRLTSPLHFSRFNPLVAVFGAAAAAPRFIVAGGARFVGGLVDIEDRLAVEIYHPESDRWELCAPLPPDFRAGNSSQWLSSALLQRREFFVFGIYSGAVAAFDLERRAWGAVRSLRPPGVLFAFLVASGGGLVLAGLCSGPARFALWSVDSRSLQYREIGAMPADLLSRLFDSDDDDARFASLKCVGLDGLVYVFNDDHHKGYPACVCEISAGGGGAAAAPECNWRKLPPLCGQINRFHKVVAFCSAVPMASILAAAE